MDVWKESCFSCPLKTNVKALCVIGLSALTGNTFGSSKLMLWHKTFSLPVMAITIFEVSFSQVSLNFYFMNSFQSKVNCGSVSFIFIGLLLLWTRYCCQFAKFHCFCIWRNLWNLVMNFFLNFHHWGMNKVFFFSILFYSIIFYSILFYDFIT